MRAPICKKQFETFCNFISTYFDKAKCLSTYDNCLSYFLSPQMVKVILFEVCHFCLSSDFLLTPCLWKEVKWLMLKSWNLSSFFLWFLQEIAKSINKDPEEWLNTSGDSGFFRLQGIKLLWRLQFLEYLRTLSLKFQKARTKIEVVLSLPCWLCQQLRQTTGQTQYNFFLGPSLLKL